jgi:anti-anti-sigma factor
MDLAAAPELRRGDHACVVFESDAAQAALVGRFASDALARGDRLFYLADRADESDVVSYLNEAGLRGRECLDRGQLQILHSSEMGLEGGFDAERQVVVWNALLDQAHDDGYAAMAACAEMTWTQSWKLEPDVVIDYERSATPLFAKGALSAICQYDARAFMPALMHRAKHVHSITCEVADGICRVDHIRATLNILGTRGIIELGGELDLASVDFVETQLRDRLRVENAIGDCAGITFIDVAGCRLLRRAAAGELGSGHLVLQNLPPLVTRVMEICHQADPRQG